MTASFAITAAALGLGTHAPRHSDTSGLWGLDGAAWATLVAGLIAGAGVLVGLLAGSARARLDTRKGVYAEAVRAVSDYLEGPYRVARCHNDPDPRFALSTDLSEIQGRIDAHLVLVELHAPDDVFQAYSAYVAVARREAGQQMAAEWRKRPPRRHADMNMERPFDRTKSNEAKQDLLAKMAKDVKPGWRPYKRFV